MLSEPHTVLVLEWLYRFRFGLLFPLFLSHDATLLSSSSSLLALVFYVSQYSVVFSVD